MLILILTLILTLIPILGHFAPACPPARRPTRRAGTNKTHTPSSFVLLWRAEPHNFSTWQFEPLASTRRQPAGLVPHQAGSAQQQ